MSTTRSPKSNPATLDLETAQRVIAEHHSQVAAAAEHAKAIAAQQSAELAERIASLREHYTREITEHMAAYLAGDESKNDSIVAALQQAKADVEQLAIPVQAPNRGAITVKGKVVFEGLAGDRAIVLRLRPCVESALGVGVSKLDSFSYTRFNYGDRTRLAPLYKMALDACESNTPDAWRDLLSSAAAYLAFFQVRNGHQGHLKPTTTDGYEMLPRFNAWHIELARRVYEKEDEARRTLSSRSSVSSLSLPAGVRDCL